MVPVDLLDILNETWCMLCKKYDVTAELPDMEGLFNGADLTMSTRASETVVVNMLSEVIECVGRFSPWYKKPAEAFGLNLIHDRPTQRAHWVLSTQAAQQWGSMLKRLSVAIEKNVGLILSASVLDGLERIDLAYDPCVLASCMCVPPRSILVSRSVITCTEIVCDTCQHPFLPVEEANH